MFRANLGLATCLAFAAHLVSAQVPAASSARLPTGDADWVSCTTPNTTSRPSQGIIAICDKVIVANRHPAVHMARAYYYRGNAHTNLGQFAGAMADYYQAIKLDPGYAKAYNNLGYVYKTQGQNDTALGYFSRAILLDPTNAIAFRNRGLIYGRLENWDAAILDFGEAVRLDPTDQESYYNRGISRYKTYQWGSAISDFEQATRLDPADADARRMLAVAQNTLGEAKSKQLALIRQREEAQRVRKAEADRQQAAQLARAMLGAIVSGLAAANEPPGEPEQLNERPPAQSYAYQSSAPAGPARQPSPQSAQGGSGKSIFLNPVTGQPCVAITSGPNTPLRRYNGEAGGTKYVVTFTNSCDRRFRVNARSIQVSNGGISVRGTSVGPMETATVSCLANGTSGDCRGFSEAWFE